MSDVTWVHFDATRGEYISGDNNSPDDYRNPTLHLQEIISAYNYMKK